jgi:hypothetical protein
LPLCQIEQLAHPRISPRFINVNNLDQIRLALEPGHDGMKTLECHLKLPQTLSRTELSRVSEALALAFALLIRWRAFEWLLCF